VTMSGRAPANVLPHYVPDDTPVVYAEDAPDEDGLVEAGMGFALVVAWVPNERGGRLIAATESGFRTRSPRAFPDGYPSGGTGCSRAWCSTPWRRVR
jgi:alpha-L-fucosidase 2